MKVILAKTYGFCPGVERAIKIAQEARKRKGEITVWKEIVHNPTVITALTKKGIKFEKNLGAIKQGVVIFSAQGVSPAARKQAKKQGLVIIDATCPLVTKAHALVKNFAKKGYEIVYIGDKGHDEVIGVMGEAPDKIKVISKKEEVKSLRLKNSKKLVVVTQTTLSIFETKEIIDALVKKFPRAQIFETICQATTLRQKAVKDLARKTQAVVVVGGRTSANSKRLKEVVEKMGKPAYLVENASQLDKTWFTGLKLIGITAGASTPEKSIQEVAGKIKSL